MLSLAVMFGKLLFQFERFINLAKLKLSRKQFIILSSILVGLTSGFVAISLKLFVHLIFTFVTQKSASMYRFLYLLLPLLGIILTVIIIRRFFGGSIQKGMAQVHSAIARKSSFMPKRNLFDQFFTSSITVGFGGSTGLEAPIVVTGAAFGSNYARTYRLTYNERTLMLACGISAGIAAAFNAPIAGVLFALEVLLVDISISAFTPLIIAAATGALVSKIVLREGILLQFKSAQSFDYVNVPFYILLGILSGLIAVYHTRMFSRVENLLSHHFKRPAIRILTAGFILAGLIAVFPPLFGEGYQSIMALAGKDPSQLLNNSMVEFLGKNEFVVLAFVGLIIFMKSIAAGLTIGGGGNGGNFAPSLFIGAYLGFFVSKATNLLKITELPESNFTLVGMAGILSGLYHAPLTSIFLIAELTGGYALMIPLMIVASFSFAISRYFEPFSMDTKNLVEKGETFTADKDRNVLTGIHLSDFIESDYPKLNAKQTLRQLVEVISSSKRNIFPVTDKQGRLKGVVLLDDVRDIMFKTEQYDQLHVSQLMRDPLSIIDINENMMDVMKRFDETGAWILPVVKNGHYVGFVSKSIVFSGYRDRLKSSTIH